MSGVHTIVDVLLYWRNKNGPRSDSNPRPADLKREIGRVRLIINQGFYLHPVQHCLF